MAQQTSQEPKIVLYQIGRGPFAPSLTPFAIKLETYLKMAKLPYTNFHGRKASSKGKFPWIEYNGQEVADTSFIIQFLNEKHHIDLNSHLSDSDRAIARAFRKMAEENLYWCTVSQRWVYDKSDFLSKVAGFPKFFLWLIRRNVKSELYEQGMGRHSEAEVLQIMEGDLKAISDFLGLNNS
ncbi:hypothetical protein LOTGIDRAFT_175070 [Lottia gigantea]|uniref:Thioredoxin-like fold domain-containing protein n=1 Tax=Lottia gigantea TaxID=225164 RepID=V4AM94_LOTGI|nr:hypothetical protein LOTGIDRAFT_175070 [Lottia gigantea]ESO95855.1 hypothetical protein LOTGIDRAFT_175070 [Lottia gigantea]